MDQKVAGEPEFGVIQGFKEVQAKLLSYHNKETILFNIYPKYSN